MANFFAVWSHFSERVLRPAADSFFDIHGEITTLKAPAIAAHPDGLRETLILHRTVNRSRS